MRDTRPVLRALVVASALACAACPGTLDDPERFTDGGASTSDCPDIPSTLFATTCAKSGCHSATDKAQQLDLASPDVAARLIGVKATEGAGLLIDPSDPTASVVYTKLTTVPPFGSRMPLAGMPVDDTTLACVLAWISASSSDAGQLDDGAATGPAEAGADAVAATDARADTSASGGGVPEGGPGGTGVPDGGARDGGPRDAGRPDAASNPPDAAQDAGSG